MPQRLLEAMAQVRPGVYTADFTRDALPELFLHLGFRSGAEIGVFKGRFTERFLQAGLGMLAVDPWMAYPEFDDERRSMEAFQAQFDGFHRIAMWRLARHPHCTVMRMTSMEAAAQVQDGSLDFVYIDGNHKFKWVAQDIWEWDKKVRSGGVVAGHDYFLSRGRPGIWPNHVRPVVDAYVDCMGIAGLVAFGDNVDRHNSWMWVKP